MKSQSNAPARLVVRYLVTGKVQGVGFRAAAQRAGRALGLDGMVRNLADGRVEAVAAGPPSALDEFALWLAHGPRFARVQGVEVAESSSWTGTPPAGAGFEIA